MVMHMMPCVRNIISWIFYIKTDASIFLGLLLLLLLLLFLLLLFCFYSPLAHEITEDVTEDQLIMS